MPDPFTLSLQAEIVRLQRIANAAQSAAEMLQQMLGDEIHDQEPERKQPVKRVWKAKEDPALYYPPEPHINGAQASPEQEELDIRPVKRRPYKRRQIVNGLPSLKDQIIDLLRYATEPMTGSQIAAELRQPTNSASARCSVMKQEGILGLEAGKGYYLLDREMPVERPDGSSDAPSP